MRLHSETCGRTVKSGFFKRRDCKPDEIRQNTKTERPHCRHTGMTADSGEVTKMLRIINIHVNSKKISALNLNVD